MKTAVTFEISISGRGDGTIEAMYIKLSPGKVAKTTELREDVLMADFDAKGKLVGFEVLAPVKMSQLIKNVEKDERESFRRFVEKSAPREMVTV